ncbi:hypothetical protein [Candidatus Tisiphia endosymbiont of Beris chalybata]|uniref:hypothetical protein n=1 Tax=Candidatus Tisiphia endosymbiont of Beris chalybata TaxID=3066262 RepID=UPI00312C926D
MKVSYWLNFQCSNDGWHAGDTDNLHLNPAITNSSAPHAVPYNSEIVFNDQELDIAPLGQNSNADLAV